MKKGYRKTIMVETLIIKGCLPTANEQIKADRNPKYSAGSILKREATQLVALYAKSQLQGNYERIKLNITYYCINKKKDPDNIAFAKKYILDGLQEAGVIKNDGWSEISSWEESFKVDKKDPRIEVVITEVLK